MKPHFVLAAVACMLLGTVAVQGEETMPDGRKVLVVYYSRTGGTERVAKDVAARLNADLEKITDLRDRRGILGWLSAGRDASRKSLTEIGPAEKDPAGYDLLVVGTPVWAWNMTPAVRTYLTGAKGRVKDIACFVTSGNTPAEKIVPSLEALAGKKAAAFTGFSAGELRNEKKYNEKLSAFVGALKK